MRPYYNCRKGKLVNSQEKYNHYFIENYDTKERFISY